MGTAFWPDHMEEMPRDFNPTVVPRILGKEGGRRDGLMYILGGSDCFEKLRISKHEVGVFQK